MIVAPRSPTLFAMKNAVFNPQRLDVPAFAKAQASLQGQAPLADLPRLAEGTCAPADEAWPFVEWHATGLKREVLGGAPEVRLRLQARARVWLTCQRCLQPMALDLAVDRLFRFMRDEDEAALVDETSDEEDVLAMSRSLDLLSLVEDELIMTLPIVPRHEVCPEPLPVPPAFDLAEGVPAPADGGHDEAAGAGNPFAVLKALKLKPRG